MSRFQLFNLHYRPDTASTGQHLTDLAEHLAAAGHEVRVLCARHRGPGGELAPSREERAGVRIRRVPATSFGRRSTLGRVADYASFHLAAGPRIAATRWPDVTVSLTTPPMLGLWGTLAKRLGGPRHVCFLMDHHPDAEFELGMLSRTSLAGRALERAYAWTLRSADHLVALGPYQARRALVRGVSPDALDVIPIWSRSEETAPVPSSENRLREELGWDERFVVLYSGNAGNVHRFEELCQAMVELEREAPHVLFAFVGDGPRRREIETFARTRALGNVQFHPPFPRADLRLLLSAADLHFVSLRPEHVGVSVPCKLYGQLGSARPVLFVGPSRCETAEDLLAAGAGRVHAPGGFKELARSILELSRDPVTCELMGLRGRAWFLENRERERCCESWRLLLEAVAAGRSLPLLGGAPPPSTTSVAGGGIQGI